MSEPAVITAAIKNVQTKTTKKGDPWYPADDGVRSFNVDLTQYEGKTVEAKALLGTWNGNQTIQITEVIRTLGEATNGGPKEFVKGKDPKENTTGYNARKAADLACAYFEPIPIPIGTDSGPLMERVKLRLAAESHIQEEKFRLLQFQTGNLQDEQHEDKDDGIPF